MKWHLAGVSAVDSRGTVETLRDSYGQLSSNQWWNGRLANLTALAGGRWRELSLFDFSRWDGRRSDEFQRLAYAFGWWNLGWLALATRAGRGSPSARPSGSRLLLGIGWAGFTLVVSALLLFEPGATVIHQGCYTVLLILLPACALALLRLHAFAFAAVFLAQWATFAGVWVRCSPGFAEGRLEGTAVVITALAAVWLLGIAASCAPATRA
jgi:hypothetical protein